VRNALRPSPFKPPVNYWNAVAAPSIVDSYSETNKDAQDLIDADAVHNGAYGQCFTATGVRIGRAVFYLSKVGSPTGNAVAKLYAGTGVFGTSMTPTGAALATSDNLDVSTLTGSFALITLTFSGANQFTMVNGTKYCLSLEYTNGSSGNSIQIGRDTSAPSHAGNGIFHDTGGWSADSTYDVPFYVYST